MLNHLCRVLDLQSGDDYDLSQREYRGSASDVVLCLAASFAFG